jgi:hypothetical protein
MIKRNPKILIVHPEGNIKNNPNLFSFTKELVKKGFDVVLFSHRRQEIFQGDLFSGASFVYFSNDKRKNFKIKIKLLKQNFCHIIGIDEGIIEAGRLANVMNTPYSFLSYEIFFDNELEKLKNTTFLKLKAKSVKACKNILFAIVQDEIRKKMLAKEYAIIPEKILLMPVAGCGIRKLEKTDYFHSRLSIPSDKQVLLYMGWMDKLQLKRLASYAAFFPENWVLVIHSRYKYAGEIPEISPKGRIYFSLDAPIESIDDLGIMLSDCDAGFCSYQADFETPFTGDNINYIGLSSGKTTTFLQYGIPIVVENMNLWDKIVGENKIGIVLSKQSDLSKLSMLQNEEVRQNCYDYFDKHLDIKNFTTAIFNFICKSDIDKKINKVQLLLFYFREIKGILKMNIKTLIKFVNG